MSSSKVTQAALHRIAEENLPLFEELVRRALSLETVTKIARVPCPRCMSNGKSMKNIDVPYEVEAFADPQLAMKMYELLLKYTVAKPEEKTVDVNVQVAHTLAELESLSLTELALAAGPYAEGVEVEDAEYRELPPAA